MAFRLMRSATFALHTDCLPACNQSLLKGDWSILLGLQEETNASGSQMLFIQTTERAEVENLRKPSQ